MKNRNFALPPSIILLSVCLFFGLSGPAQAVPANPALVNFSQPDGTKIKVALRGDEFYHWNEDAKGYTIIKDTSTKTWYYAEKDASGALKPGSYKVGAADPQGLGLTRRLIDSKGAAAGSARHKARDASSLFIPRLSADLAAQSASSPQKTPILTGTMKNLVILVRFPDQTTTYSQAQFSSLFNDTGYTYDGALGSVKDYYKEVSYGKLTVQSVVTPWITLSHNAAYYGANGSDGFDVKPQQMVAEAIDLLHASGFDFTTVDGNGDGQVDGLDIIHSGRGEEWGGNNTNYIWSHEWDLSSASPSLARTYNGVRMDHYHTESEMRGWDNDHSTWGLTRIGVICHETGHFLGLPDLYDTSATNATYGLGRFCLMAAGSWNGPDMGGYTDGSSPAHMSAWCKKTLGWAAPTQLTTIGTKTLPGIEISSTSMFLLRDSSFPSTEYFLIENKQGAGNFDAYLPGPNMGILIWHIAEDKSDNSDAGQTAADHYLVDLEEASGTQYLEQIDNGSDASFDNAYFRYPNKSVFGDLTNPNSKSYAGYNLNLPISDISASGSPMTFYLGTSDTTPPTTIATVNDGLGADISATGSLTQLSANWTASSDPESGISAYYYAIGTSAGATDVSGWTSNGTALSVTRAGLSLTSGVTYYFGVKALNTVGLYSAEKWSNGQTVNASAPADVPYVYDGTGSDITYVSSLHTLSANWGASPSSGITEYDYAIGTTRGGVETLGWTSNALATSVTQSGLSLTDGTTYYFAVKAKNSAGFYSAASASDGQKVDVTSPTATVTVTSALPSKTGSFTADLAVTDANSIVGTPQLYFRTSTGYSVQLPLTYKGGSTWGATGFTESYYSTGTATFYFSASDPVGNAGSAITSGGTFAIDTSISGVDGGSVFNSDGSSVTVQAGTYSSLLYIAITTVPASRCSAADAASPDSAKMLSSDLVREFTARNSAGVILTVFSSSPTITIPYPDSNGDGFIDGDMVRESLAWLYYMDETAGRWTPLTGVRLYPATNRVSAEVSHFSVYSIRGKSGSGLSLVDLKAYPSPCYFRSDPVLTFSGIPLDAVNPMVLIYNEAGELVRKLSPGDGIDSLHTASWNGRLSGGSKAASGLYIYLVRTDNYGRGKGKFFIVW